MEWTPCSISLKKCGRCEGERLFVAETKLPTKTSTRFVYVTLLLACAVGFLFDMLLYVPQGGSMLGLPHVIVYQ